ncbi:hypothetical protein ACG83_03490 [Frankia sp. R43]|uniref:helix-turn-helix transcriptional regulator n=1 Tax=Frankia sp. R43 TaxID=269536 RepID=UPI0006CA497E|nr:helix-turn-helix transcriptional regulator [Frankia sp. R43]KPM56910.1 hypothetical protein ACG83_03490 [Frankia sp. R43]
MTPDHTDSRSLRAVIGEGVRRVRTAKKGVRQEDVAKAARSYGLNWDYSRVAALERGEKAISAEELALLPDILSIACVRLVKLPNLIDPDVWVQVGGRVMPGSDLIKIYAGQGALRAQAAHTNPDDWIRRNVEVTRAWDDRDRLMRLGAIVENSEYFDLHALVASVTVGLTEERTARRIGERPLVVAYLSRLLWGRPLGEQRDRLVSERADAGDDPARLRALRGRVTRQLIDEMTAEIGRREAHHDLYAEHTRHVEFWSLNRDRYHAVSATSDPKLHQHRIDTDSPGTVDEWLTNTSRRDMDIAERAIADVREQFRERGLPLPTLPSGFPRLDAEATALARLAAASGPLGEADTPSTHGIDPTNEDTQ